MLIASTTTMATTTMMMMIMIVMMMMTMTDERNCRRTMTQHTRDCEVTHEVFFVLAWP